MDNQIFRWNNEPETKLAGLATLGLPSEIPLLQSFGLGLAPIPWTDCWSPPGGTNPDDRQFRNCHRQAWIDADSQCRNYNPNRYDSFDDCKQQTADVLVSSGCLKYCKPTAATYRGSDPCNSAAAVAYLQKQLGVGSDGSFGPVTRAALERNGSTMQGLIGCTGPCPSSVPANLCAGDCLPGFERDPATGLCVSSGTAPPPYVPPMPEPEPATGAKKKKSNAGTALLAGASLVAIVAAIIGGAD